MNRYGERRTSRSKTTGHNDNNYCNFRVVNYCLGLYILIFANSCAATAEWENQGGVYDALTEGTILEGKN